MADATSAEATLTTSPSDSTRCGAATGEGSACQLPPSQEDGRCHLHSSHTDTDDVGRPSKLESHYDEIMDLAELGLSQKGIANAAAVAESTLHRWKDQYPEFRQEFRRARARGESYLIREGMKKDGEVNTEVAKFILERSFGYTKGSAGDPLPGERGHGGSR
jgi:hypothetical protein